MTHPEDAAQSSACAETASPPGAFYLEYAASSVPPSDLVLLESRQTPPAPRESARSQSRTSSASRHAERSDLPDVQVRRDGRGRRIDSDAGRRRDQRSGRPRIRPTASDSRRASASASEPTPSCRSIDVLRGQRRNRGRPDVIDDLVPCPPAAAATRAASRAPAPPTPGRGTTRATLRWPDGSRRAGSPRTAPAARPTARRRRPRASSGAAAVVEPHVRDRAAGVVVGLGGDPRARVRLGHPALLDEPRTRSSDVGVHDDDQREDRRHPALDEQRDVLHDDGVRGAPRPSARPTRSRTRGWTIALSRARASASPKTTDASAGRSSSPSAADDVVAEGRDDLGETRRCRPPRPRGPARRRRRARPRARRAAARPSTCPIRSRRSAPPQHAARYGMRPIRRRPAVPALAGGGRSRVPPASGGRAGGPIGSSSTRSARSTRTSPRARPPGTRAVGQRRRSACRRRPGDSCRTTRRGRSNEHGRARRRARRRAARPSSRPAFELPLRAPRRRRPRSVAR